MPSRPILLTVAAGLLVTAAEVSPQRGRLLFEDDFSTLKKTWRVTKGKWNASGGQLKGVELAADKHAAVVRHPVPFRNAAIELDFKLEGARMVAMSINRAGGHSCRAILKPDGLTLQKDPDKQAGEKKAAVLATKAVNLADGKWHKLTLEIHGAKMAARIDAGEWISGQNPGIDVDKVDVGLPVAGDGASFDALRVWELR